MEVAVLSLLIPILALMIPITAIIVGPAKTRGQQREREEARKMYERIVRDKLDVMKTALAMGFKQDELKDLDTRLESLIGREKLEGLLDPTPATPVAPAEAHNADLLTELDEVRRMQRQRQ